MEDLYRKTQNKRVYGPRRRKRISNNDIVTKLENEKQILMNKLKEMTKIKNELEEQYENVLTLLSSELDFNNSISDKYENLLKRTISQDTTLKRSKNTRTTIKQSRRPITKPPTFKPLPLKKRPISSKKK